MQLHSTNNKNLKVGLKEAVLQGLAPDGGLFMPEVIEMLPQSFFDEIDSMSFQDIGFEVVKHFLGDDIPEGDLRKIITETLNFEAPIVKVEDGIHSLELYHGPTLAFKDFGARFMSRLMAYFNEGSDKELVVLVATSGDTGSAVANGFYNVPGIRVVLLYPSGKVSNIQEQQLTTLGGNVTALEVEGVFDDCQRMVKEAFVDDDLSEVNLTSANSINIARLIPQSLYYFDAYRQLQDKSLPVVFSVPSGNFGNLTAGLMAKKMGLLIHQFIASTNVNDIVPEYLETGIFTPRASQSTISNAMDVGNPSNFVRIKELYENDIDRIRSDIKGCSFTDNETKSELKNVHNRTDYLMDTHGAVAYLGLKKYLSNQEGQFNGIFLETAHPAKFADVVEPVIGSKIKMPPSLQDAMNKKKESIVIPGDYEALKEYLLINQ